MHVHMLHACLQQQHKPWTQHQQWERGQRDSSSWGETATLSLFMSKEAGKETQVISYGKTAMLLTAVRDEKKKTRQQGFGLQAGLPVGGET